MGERPDRDEGPALLLARNFVVLCAYALSLCSTNQRRPLLRRWQPDLGKLRQTVVRVPVCIPVRPSRWGTATKCPAFLNKRIHLLSDALRSVPAGSPSRGGDVTVCVCHKPAELAHSFLFCSCVCFCLYGPFNCISFHQFSQQLSVF